MSSMVKSCQKSWVSQLLKWSTPHVSQLLRRLRRASPAAAGARAKAAGATTAVAADARGLGAVSWILMGYFWDLIWH